VIPIAGLRSRHLDARVCVREPIPLFDLPGSLELGSRFALTPLQLAPLLAMARRGLNLGSDLPALILAVVMSVLPLLRLRRRRDDKERGRCREYLSVLHRSSIRSVCYITQYPRRRDVCRF
jgi:hypothetical protein